MKVSKTENQFKTGFQQPKTGFPKNPVLTSLKQIIPMQYIITHQCFQSYKTKIIYRYNTTVQQSTEV